MTAPIPPFPVAALAGIWLAGQRGGGDERTEHGMSDDWHPRWPAEVLADADAAIESTASTYDAITVLPGIGDVLRETWAAIRPRPLCDCPMDPYHRWNCPLTPIWAQTIRELDCNPWTVVRP